MKVSVPQWLIEAATGLLASAYEAGRADVAVETPQPEPLPDVLDRHEAARLVRVKLTKLRELTHREEDPVPSFMLGSRRLYRREEVEEWLRRQPKSHRRANAA